jgi:hypothetical protein
MLNQSIISEVDKGENFDEYSPEYHYSSIGVLPRDSNPNEIGVVFFNGVVFGKSDYREPEQPRMILFKGPLGEFEFDSKHIHYNGKSPYVFGNKLNDRYYDELLPLMTSKSDKQSLNDFTSQEIRDALKMAFPEYWKEKTEDYTAGLRGIHTIGEKMDDDSETWSIMNFFDTREIPKLINQKWKKEGTGNKVKWLSSVFQNDDDFLNKLLIKQWGSVYNGFFKNEESTMSNLKKMFNDPNVKFKTYPFGHKMDRHGGVDVEIKIPGEEKPLTVQIKPMEKRERLSNGDIKVYTNGMTNDYKRKNNLGYILYNKGNNFIMFKNDNYDVTPSTDGREVIHKDKPFMVY